MTEPTYKLSRNPFAIATFTQTIDDIVKAHLGRGCDPQDIIRAMLLAAQRVADRAGPRRSPNER